MITRKALDRRTFLRGVGTAVALPFLDSMVPAFATPAQSKTPLRMVFTYVPNGIDMANWNATSDGPWAAEMPRILQPLAAYKDDILQMGNLTHNSGRALLDGAGDHGRCCGSYLTGIQVKKTFTDIKASVSCDQLVANQLGKQTRFPSLEIGLEDARQAGDCDSGYSCAYTNNLAWRNETQPLPPTLDPRLLFERLFGDGVALSPEARARQAKYRRSILDFVSGDAQKLQTNLGPTDKRKLDEYLTSIREIERQIEKAEKDNAQVDPKMEKPYGTPADFAEHFRLMTDMMTVAMQSDMTRVMTYLITREGTSRAYREIGISDGHHPLTHHRNQKDQMDKVTLINEYMIKQFALWIGKLKTIQDGDGTLLDHSMIVYGAGLSDGNRHLHEDLPTIIVGKANGTLKTGRRVTFRKETPMCNLFLSMMDRMGCQMDHFGDATGRLEGVDLT